MTGNSEQLKEQLRAAGQLTRQNQTSRAANEQRAAAANLERMLTALEEQKADDADRMRKKLKDADRELNELFDKQELLQKKAEAAESMQDPQQRQAELDKLAREQAKLEAEARDLAQRLSRNQADQAAEELRRAVREMAQAREQLENGDAAAARMDDALDRLDDAQRELDQAREKNVEELLREQAAKFADEIKALRDRAQRLTDESARIHQVVKKAGKWERPVRTSLNDLRQQQEGLAKEVRALIEKKFEQAAVFGRMLRQAADAMDLAARRIDARLDATETGPFDLELEDIADAGIEGQQKLAVKRLDQLLDALKPDQQAGGAPPMGDTMPPDMPPMGGGKPGEQLPPLAQLKALRGLQADIAERTEAFDKAHPDRSRLNDDEVAELESLQRMQLDVAELIKLLTDAAMPGM
jgi:myosin heavy subunit